MTNLKSGNYVGKLKIDYKTTTHVPVFYVIFFAKAMVVVFGVEYLRAPNAQDT